MWAALVTADGFLVAVHSRSSLTMGFKPTCFYAVGFALLCVVLFCVVLSLVADFSIWRSRIEIRNGYGILIMTFLDTTPLQEVSPASVKPSLPASSGKPVHEETESLSQGQTLSSIDHVSHHGQSTTKNEKGSHEASPSKASPKVLSTAPQKTTREPLGSKIYQPPRQFYDAARRARHLGVGTPPAIDLIAASLRPFLSDLEGGSLELAVASLFALAGHALENTSPKKLPRLLTHLTPEKLNAIVETLNDFETETLRVARRQVRDAAKRQKAEAATRIQATKSSRRLPHAKLIAPTTETSSTAFTDTLRALTGARHSLRWDSLHDGHLLLRDDAWKLGIVRYALALSPDRDERVNLAIQGAKTLGHGAASLWRHKRPLLVAQDWSPYVEKLLTDLWVCDPSVGLLLLNDPGALTQAEDWLPALLGVPTVIDTHGYIAPFLSLNNARLPAIVEHVLGGVSVTLATGWVRLERHLPVVAPWAKTLAEIAFTQAFTRKLQTTMANKIPYQARHRWLDAYTQLVNDLPVESPEGNHTVKDRLTCQNTRRSFATMRREAMANLTRWVNAAKPQTSEQTATDDLTEGSTPQRSENANLSQTAHSTPSVSINDVDADSMKAKDDLSHLADSDDTVEMDGMEDIDELDEIDAMDELVTRAVMGG